MANDLNQCQFIGRLGRDPEIKNLPSGKSVANFSLATGWKGKDSEGTEWVRCVAFDKLADIIGQYVQKGSQIYVSGKMRTRKWKDKTGADRESVEINVDQMQLLGGRGDSSASAAPAPRPAARTAPAPAPAPADDDMDIPF